MCVTFNPLFASLVKGGGLPQASQRDFIEIYGIKKNVRDLLILFCLP